MYASTLRNLLKLNTLVFTFTIVCMCACVCVCICVGLCVHLRALKAVWHSDETNNLAGVFLCGAEAAKAPNETHMKLVRERIKQTNLRLGVEAHKERCKRTHTSKALADVSGNDAVMTD